MIRQKMDAEGKPLPIWSWLLQQDNVTVALGERRSEQQATLAAEAAEQRYGSGLETAQSVRSTALST